jgi:hypothetical protein
VRRRSEEVVRDVHAALGRREAALEHGAVGLRSVRTRSYVTTSCATP